MTSTAMPIDLGAIPALDHHCHPFGADSVDLTANLLRNSISVSLRGDTSVLNESMLLSRVTVAELGKLLECAPTFEAVVGARNEIAAQGYGSYISTLFQAQNISGLLFDPGFPAEPVLRGDEFADLIPVPVWEGYRIERFFPYGGSFNGAEGEGPARSFPELLDAFEAALDTEAARPRFAFFKSIMAYRTGLAIQPTTFSEAEAAWDAHRAYGDPSEKVIRDYLLHVTCRKAREYDVPLQLHTGHTSHNNPWPNANPILLTPFLNQPEITETKIVLVHSGYPYCTEAGYLTSIYPLVWCDLSLMIPWASVGIANRIVQVLESAPTSKVLYGSDAINIPELNWLGALVGRRGLSQALSAIAAAGYLRPGEIEEVAADILHRNTEALYGLPTRSPVPASLTAAARSGRAAA